MIKISKKGSVIKVNDIKAVLPTVYKIYRPGDYVSYVEVDHCKIDQVIYIDDNGFSHRENGPAEEYDNGMKVWRNHGRFHRLDGPAVMHPNNKNYWWHEGVPYNCDSQEDFERFLKLRSFL
jgi:hypothetical protein